MNDEELIVRFNEAFNRHDVGAMMALMSADCVFENTFPPPAGERFAGQVAVRAFWQEFFRQSPHARIEVEELFACGERAAQRWEYSWVDYEGKAGSVRGVDVFHVRDGKITAKLSYVKG